MSVDQKKEEVFKRAKKARAKKKALTIEIRNSQIGKVNVLSLISKPTKLYCTLKV